MKGALPEGSYQGEHIPSRVRTAAAFDEYATRKEHNCI